MKDLFIDFLIENGAFDNVTNAFENITIKQCFGDIDNYLSKLRPSNYIGALCEWNNTPPYFSYWAKLNDAWKSILNQQES